MACFGNFFFFLAPSPDVPPAASGQLTDPRTLHTHTHTHNKLILQYSIVILTNPIEINPSSSQIKLPQAIHDDDKSLHTVKIYIYCKYVQAIYHQISL